MSNYLMIIPGSATLSLVVWIIIAILVLYLGRQPAHMVIRSLMHLISAGLRMSSRSINGMADRMAKRNREILLEFGREQAERRMEREFMRLDSAVKRDLGNYPALHRQIQEKMHQLELDYRASTEEQPPNVDGWEKAITAVAKIPTHSHTMVAEVLDGIKDSFNNTHKQVLLEYRKINKERHKTLGRLIPTVRNITLVMEQVDKNIRELTDRARDVGKHMEEYREVMAKSDKAEHRLASSALFQFFISGLVLTIAMFGAFINFNMVELPMREVVGANNYIQIFGQGVRISAVGAMVIIAIEIAMGLFLMELLRVTRLFPGITSIDDRMRKRLLWIALFILVFLAGIEAALAYTRDLREAISAAFKLNLSTATATPATAVATAQSIIPLAGQMALGFVLPFALIFIAIPLESFVHSALTGMRTILVVTLRLVAFCVRIVAMFFRQLGSIVVRFYDLVIIIPLWIEQRLAPKSQDGRRSKGKVGVI